jgi:hypothetical protein
MPTPKLQHSSYGPEFHALVGVLHQQAQARRTLLTSSIKMLQETQCH